MASPDRRELTGRILDRAVAEGVSLAGVASRAAVESAPSYAKYAPPSWPAWAKSVLVLALVHQDSEPELDWWDGSPEDGTGDTPGNRRLAEAGRSLAAWLKAEHDAAARLLPYQVTYGGVFLKDAAVLAGLGVIGRSNLLVTPQFGPRVRFRALLVDLDLEPTPAAAFDPCRDCDLPCHRVCPQKAFRDGRFDRGRCDRQMDLDVARGSLAAATPPRGEPVRCVKYCRLCELACPVGG